MKVFLKHKCNELIVNRRNVYTRAHDATCPNNEKFKRNISYTGALKWNKLPVFNRNIEKYESFKSLGKKWLLSTINLQR